jgi:hypothetical protein
VAAFVAGVFSAGFFPAAFMGAAFFAAPFFSFFSVILLAFDFHEMAHLADHSAQRRAIFPHDLFAEPAEPEPL